MSVRLKAPVSIIKNYKQSAGIDSKFNDLILIQEQLVSMVEKHIGQKAITNSPKIGSGVK